jgi:hypothetical protein
MLYRWFADAVVLIHALFVLFVVGGGFLAIRWRRLVWLHVPAAVWGALIEFTGWTCPLTPLEDMLRERAGQAGYAGGFVDHYVLRALYPRGLTSHTQLILGLFVVGINGVAYFVQITIAPHVGSPSTRNSRGTSDG